MKSTFKVFIFIGITFLLMSTHSVYSQKQLDEETIADLQKTSQYAFGVSEELYFRGVLGMYDLLVGNGVEVTDYEIVVKGKLVAKLVKGSELEEFFRKYRSKVRVSICSVAMEKLNVTEDQLFDGLDVVATYSVRLLQLQARGYNTLFY
ncbi:DsrE family protein [Robiginitalea sp. SC105]|uniref:DsrE family protein n=1 Tax=Robiginitalea sp. SC105 TaxID=2762332 RepID=UPI00163A6FF5|nr:DsrE family protein [Robiginitalea sp. SC105]MBC2838962.1 hypothetical protein [Robiginitalea sp. SC105]